MCAEYSEKQIPTCRSIEEGGLPTVEPGDVYTKVRRYWSWLPEGQEG